MTQAELPLLGRPEVLFPGSVLRLHLNDPRQLSLLNTATRSVQSENDQGSFGFCLLLPDVEASSPQQMRIGTEALIEDYNLVDNGSLLLTLRGGRRFRIGKLHCQYDGTMKAEVEWLPAEQQQIMPLKYAPMMQVVARYLEKVQADYPEYTPADNEDSGFVGFRLADLLPMELAEKQMLLELSDPLMRLKILASIIPRFQQV